VIERGDSDMGLPASLVADRLRPIAEEVARPARLRDRQLATRVLRQGRPLSACVPESDDAAVSPIARGPTRRTKRQLLSENGHRGRFLFLPRLRTEADPARKHYLIR
jgi:hypothetical protein